MIIYSISKTFQKKEENTITKIMAISMKVQKTKRKINMKKILGKANKTTNKINYKSFQINLIQILLPMNKKKIILRLNSLMNNSTRFFNKMSNIKKNQFKFKKIIIKNLKNKKKRYKQFNKKKANL